MAHSAPGTRLTRKTPQENIYDDVRVIGFSPISFSSGREVAEWQGQQAKVVTIAPVEFGPNIDVPLGELEADYDVVSVPEGKPHSVPEPPQDSIAPFSDRPAPEDTFRDREKDKSTTGEREKTPLTEKKKPGRPPKAADGES